MLERAGWIVWDDRDGPGLGDGFAEGVGVVGGIGQHGSRSILSEQGDGLRRIPPLPGGEDEPDRAAEAPHGEVDLRAQPAPGAAYGLILSPFFAPAACW